MTAPTATTEELLAELFGVRPRVDDGGAMGFTRRESKQVKYWKKPDGWVTIGPTRTSDGPEYLRYLENKKYKPLPDSYGVEVAGNGSMQVRDGTKQLQRFIGAGGLTARDEQGDFGVKGDFILPRDQILALGMHRRMPDIKKLRPDLADHQDVECRYAGCTFLDEGGVTRKRLFTSESAREQHVSVAHKEAVASEAVGQAIARAMDGQRGQAVDTNLIAAITAAVVGALGATAQTAIANLGASAPEAELPPAYLARVEAAEAAARAQNFAGDGFDEMTRSELMTYAKEINMPFPKNQLRMKEPEWRALVRAYAAAHPFEDAA